MKFTVNVKNNMQDFDERISDASKKAIVAVSSQALKDSNLYCRVDTGTLRRSSLIHSNLKNGTLRWSTPYARKAYFMGSPLTYKNPNATLMWAHRAYEVHGEEWGQVYKRAMAAFLKK